MRRPRPLGAPPAVLRPTFHGDRFACWSTDAGDEPRPSLLGDLAHPLQAQHDLGARHPEGAFQDYGRPLGVDPEPTEVPFLVGVNPPGRFLTLCRCRAGVRRACLLVTGHGLAPRTWGSSAPSGCPG